MKRIITPEHTVYPFLFDGSGKRISGEETIKKLKSLTKDEADKLINSSEEFKVLYRAYEDKYKKPTGDNFSIKEMVKVKIV